VKEGRKMPRRGNIAKRDVLADPIYNSKMVTRLVNSVMLDGKKGVAQKIVYEARPATILWRLSRRRWRTSCPASSARPAVLVALTTRFPWRSAPLAARLWVCAG